MRSWRNAARKVRVFAIALGYEDVNDHDGLRDDLALQTACGKDRRLASSSTVGRLDRAADRAWAWAAHVAMVEAFIASFDQAPGELILDFDATYAAASWKVERRVIARIEHGRKGANPRYVVTNLEGDGRHLYEKLYYARGEMENRIKEQQLALFADRTSCHRWWPNQFRLLLSSLVYTLIETIRRLAYH